MGSLAVDVERELVSDLVFGLSLVGGGQCPFSRWGSHHKLVDSHKVRFNFTRDRTGHGESNTPKSEGRGIPSGASRTTHSSPVLGTT